MDKQKLLKALLEKMEEELLRLKAANERAAAGATNSETKAETKWDTCGLEASYLARGHAEQFRTLAAEVHNLRGFVAGSFEGRSIAPGALIEADLGRGPLMFFLLHCGGGIDLRLDGQDEVTVITLESPIGAALLGKKEGDSFSFRAGEEAQVVAVY